MKGLRKYFLLVALGCILLGCASKEQNPKLIVFISIDSWRFDLLERFKDQYSGGFKKNYENAIIYTQALNDFSVTKTDPGHVVLLSGVYSSKKGIIKNIWFDRNSNQFMYCIRNIER